MNGLTPAIVPAVITIDTEPDNVWADHRSRGARNIAALLRLQTLLERFGARATLLLTHEVATNAEAIETLKRLAGDHGAEIGAHLHPWDNPPFSASGLDTRHRTFPHELSDAEFRAKLERLTETIQRNFPAPRSYRAGRYGLAASHVGILEQLGFEADTSVTPLVNWRATLGLPPTEGGRGGIDYRGAPLDSYHPAYDDVTRPGDARLLEVPVTIGATRRLPRRCLRGIARMPRIAQSALRRAAGVSIAWARPTGQPAGAALRVIEAAIRRPARAINIMFHSSELIVGGSPSTPDADAVDAVFQRLREMLSRLSEQSAVRFMTLGEAEDCLTANKRWQSSVAVTEAEGVASVDGRCGPTEPATPVVGAVRD